MEKRQIGRQYICANRHSKALNRQSVVAAYPKMKIIHNYFWIKLGLFEADLVRDLDSLQASFNPHYKYKSLGSFF